METISIQTEYIKLQDLLKLARLVGSGGEAKILIQSGAVAPPRAGPPRRGKKLRPGDTVFCQGKSLRVTDRP